MSKTKKLIASALAIVSLAAVPSTSIVLSGSGQAVQLACGNGSTGCRVMDLIRERKSPSWGSSYSGMAPSGSIAFARSAETTLPFCSYSRSASRIVERLVFPACSTENLCQGEQRVPWRLSASVRAHEVHRFRANRSASVDRAETRQNLCLHIAARRRLRRDRRFLPIRARAGSRSRLRRSGPVRRSRLRVLPLALPGLGSAIVLQCRATRSQGLLGKVRESRRTSRQRRAVGARCRHRARVARNVVRPDRPARVPRKMPEHRLEAPQPHEEIRLGSTVTIVLEKECFASSRLRCRRRAGRSTERRRHRRGSSKVTSRRGGSARTPALRLPPRRRTRSRRRPLTNPMESQALPECSIVIRGFELGNRSRSNLEQLIGAIGLRERAQKGQLDLGTKPEHAPRWPRTHRREPLPRESQSPRTRSACTELAGELGGFGNEVDGAGEQIHGRRRVRALPGTNACPAEPLAAGGGELAYVFVLALKLFQVPVRLLEVVADQLVRTVAAIEALARQLV